MKNLSTDVKYMKTAIELAKKGIGKTSPNPVVGAVLVRNRRIVAQAYHKKAGAPHAEASAIKVAGKNARGATLYSTLEACTHYGKTPPCTDTIIKSGIKKAVFAMRDPNPINKGRGISKLRYAGIETNCGILEHEALVLNRPFVKFMRKRLPYVTIKMAQSVDGKIADSRGRSRWITSGPSRQFVHELRARNDAILIGANTLIKDNPLLTNRSHGNSKKKPVRIILDSNLRTPLRSRILEKGNSNAGDVLIAGGEGASLEKKALLERKGARVILFPRKNGRVNLVSLMRYLARNGIMSVLCEGGGELSASLLKDRLADEAFFFVSPRIIGGKTAPTSCDGVSSDIRESIALENVKVERIGRDILIRGEI